MSFFSSALAALLSLSLISAPFAAAGSTIGTPFATSSPFVPTLTNSNSLQPSSFSQANSSNTDSGGISPLAVGGGLIGIIGLGLLLKSAITSVATNVAADTAVSAATPFKSVGGKVAGPTGACLSMNGGVGEIFHLIPDGRTVPLVPPDYIWTPTTITLPIPEKPPVIGTSILGLVYPGFAQSLCIKSTFPFITAGGWQLYYVGESLTPSPL